VNGVETVQHIAKIPWVAIATAGAFMAVFIVVTWWNTKNIKTNSDLIRKILTGEQKTKNGEIQMYRNGEQDKKLETALTLAEKAHKNSENNSGEISKIWKAFGKVWEAIENIKAMLKKFTENQKTIERTQSGILENSVELVAAVKEERKENFKYLKNFGDSVLKEIREIKGES
jgi:hypothetical protein